MSMVAESVVSRSMLALAGGFDCEMLRLRGGSKGGKFEVLYWRDPALFLRNWLSNETSTTQQGVRMGRAFSSISEADSKGLEIGLAKAKKLGVPALRLVGRWRDRRFVIADLQPSESPANSADHDYVDLVLTIPIDANAETIVKECHRFGKTVEKLCRRHKEVLDPVIALLDGVEHRIDPYDHLAICGQPGPWADYLVSKIFTADKCQRCIALAKTWPKTTIM
jgi:hypothetical protein